MSRSDEALAYLAGLPRALPDTVVAVEFGTGHGSARRPMRRYASFVTIGLTYVSPQSRNGEVVACTDGVDRRLSPLRPKL